MTCGSGRPSDLDGLAQARRLPEAVRGQVEESGPLAVVVRRVGVLVLLVAGVPRRRAVPAGRRAARRLAASDRKEIGKCTHASPSVA